MGKNRRMIIDENLTIEDLDYGDIFKVTDDAINSDDNANEILETFYLKTDSKSSFALGRKNKNRFSTCINLIDGESIEFIENTEVKRINLNLKQLVEQELKNLSIYE
jgi:hypothetical protein